MDRRGCRDFLQMKIYMKSNKQTDTIRVPLVSRRKRGKRHLPTWTLGSSMSSSPHPTPNVRGSSNSPQTKARERNSMVT
jgi:hypothetical protein